MVRYGRAAFEAYKAKVGGKTYDKKDIPNWDSLGDPIRHAWMEAAHAAIELWIRNNHDVIPSNVDFPSVPPLDGGLDGNP
jgi:hypothetical protein